MMEGDSSWGKDVMCHDQREIMTSGTKTSGSIYSYSLIM